MSDMVRIGMLERISALERKLDETQNTALFAAESLGVLEKWEKRLDALERRVAEDAWAKRLNALEVAVAKLQQPPEKPSRGDSKMNQIENLRTLAKWLRGVNRPIAAAGVDELVNGFMTGHIPTPPPPACDCAKRHAVMLRAEAAWQMTNGYVSTATMLYGLADRIEKEDDHANS